MARDWTQEEFGITGKEPDAYEQLKSELAKVKKQLAIVVEALEKIKEMTSPPCYIPDFEPLCILASLSLQQIKELEK